MNGQARTLKVFLSHTSEMAEHPASRSFVTAALDAVREAGMVAVDMRDFPAASVTPTELDGKHVLECDVYLGILGFRYGMPARDQPDVSYTRQEFRTAKEAGKTLLVFLLDEKSEGLPGTVFIDHKYGSQQEAFRQEVMNLDGQGLVCQFFRTTDELQRLVLRALQYCSRDTGVSHSAGPTATQLFDRVLMRYATRQTQIWQSCLNGQRDQQDRLDHYVEPHYSLLKPESQFSQVASRFGYIRKGIEENGADGHSAYEPVAADGDSAELELEKLLRTSRRLCLAEDAGAGKSVFTRRALAFASSRTGQDSLFDGKPGLAVRWEQWEKDWPTDFHRALADAIADDCGEHEPRVSPDDLVTWALLQGRVLLILDGLDQVNNDTVIRGVSVFLSGAGRKCRAIITGRSYKVDLNRRNLFRGDEWRFARIEGFNDEQIASYLAEYDIDELFPQHTHVRDLLRIPSVLRIVRELLEQDQTIRSFSTRGEVYLQASYQLILRSGRMIDPNFDDRQTRRVEQILSAVAFEMMTRELYGYAARGVDTVDQIERGAASRCGNGISDREWTLIRSVTNLTNHCILEGNSQTMLSWQHRGMMEFYCGLQLARYANDQCIGDASRLAAVPDWYWAWRFAIEMPDAVADATIRTATLSHLYRVPAQGRRPSELIYRAWKVMEASAAGCEILNVFRTEYTNLLAAGNLLAREIEDSFCPCPPNPERDSLTFLMGSPDTDLDAHSEEKPQIQMKVMPFHMANTPVTKAQYWLYDPTHQHDFTIANDLENYSPEPDCPVLLVKWYDAWCFAKWCGARLPTEIEWEYACRAGTRTRYWWGHDMDDSKCTFGTNHATPASKQHANPWQLMEMSGNVYEWCDTWYASDIAISADRFYVGDSRVLRGGSFVDCIPQNLRSADRYGEAPERRGDFNGFRISRTP